MPKVDQLLLQKNISNGNLERLQGAKATQRVLGESNVDISSLSERKVSASEPGKTPRDMDIAAQRWNSASEAGERCRSLCSFSVLARVMRSVLSLSIHCDEAAQSLLRPHSRPHLRPSNVSTSSLFQTDFCVSHQVQLSTSDSDALMLKMLTRCKREFAHTGSIAQWVRSGAKLAAKATDSTGKLREQGCAN
jgi:hypothetical protein